MVERAEGELDQLTQLLDSRREEFEGRIELVKVRGY